MNLAAGRVSAGDGLLTRVKVHTTIDGRKRPLVRSHRKLSLPRLKAAGVCFFASQLT